MYTDTVQKSVILFRRDIFFFLFQLYIYTAVMSFIVGWTHLRVDFLLKFCTMFLSLTTIVFVFSQAPIARLYNAIEAVE